MNQSFLTLIQTAPAADLGSMNAHARMVREAIEHGASELTEVTTCHFYDTSRNRSMRGHHIWRLHNAKAFFNEHSSDFYHLLDGSMAAFLPRSIWDRTMVTVHDLIPLLQLGGRMAGRPGFAARILIKRSLEMLQTAAGVCCVSSCTKQDLQSRIKRSDVHIIHNAVRAFPESRSSPEDLPERFILHVGNNADYKNRSGVIDIFSQLQDLSNLHLIMAGPPPTKHMLKKAEELERVHFYDQVPDPVLATLYQKAALFLFPSKYEGFGMPVLEAMSQACPVVCSSEASLPEVAGDAALMALAEDVDRLAGHCRSLLSDEALREEMVSKGKARAHVFSVKRFSEELLAWYSELIG